ncbi:hypothetical protein RCO28_30475 [Streptomyces sp. LHD-70]|uniref:hypothetical protein n=1 Tax=Streptomyces sp. LHD-70 TaxID=3072140 RepID=UPI00280FDF78|nr:hypothetical protein [Streptomyces sp. LHD-70]MDQ8706766.1 hypothetical protein [Streptomyces sp. LHD-70]
MSTKPQDLEYAPLLDFALPKVSYADPDGVTFDIALYHAVTTVLRDAGLPTIPMGSFTRLVRAAGFARKSWRNKGRQTWYFAGLNLREDAP